MPTIVRNGNDYVVETLRQLFASPQTPYFQVFVLNAELEKDHIDEINIKMCNNFYKEIAENRLVVLKPPSPLYAEKLGRPCNLTRTFEDEMPRFYWRSKQVRL